MNKAGSPHSRSCLRNRCSAEYTVLAGLHSTQWTTFTEVSNLSQPARADGGKGRRSIYKESLVHIFTLCTYCTRSLTCLFSQNLADSSTDNLSLNHPLIKFPCNRFIDSPYTVQQGLVFLRCHLVMKTEGECCHVASSCHCAQTSSIVTSHIVGLVNR